MNPLEDYYRYLDDFKKNNKNIIFKKQFKISYDNKSYKNIEEKYNKLGKYLELKKINNSNDIDTNDVTKKNNNENHIPQYIAKNNDNQISNNNNIINSN